VRSRWDQSLFGERYGLNRAGWKSAGGLIESFGDWCCCIPTEEYRVVHSDKERQEFRNRRTLHQQSDGIRGVRHVFLSSGGGKSVWIAPSTESVCQAGQVRHSGHNHSAFRQTSTEWFDAVRRHRKASRPSLRSKRNCFSVEFNLHGCSIRNDERSSLV